MGSRQLRCALSSCAASCRRPHGFTMIEIMVVVTIVAILLTVGLPPMAEFVADQRVRTVTSDISSELSLGRAKAIESSRRVYMEKLGILWNNGWRLYVDNNDNAVYDAGIDLELKRFDGFSTGTIYICTLPIGVFTTQIVLRPDGRVARPGAVTANDGIYVVDTLGDGNPNNDKIRGVQFGFAGRATVMKMNGQVLPCVAN